MTTTPTEPTTRRKPLRLWPGVILVALMLGLWFGAPLVAPEKGAIVGLLGGAAGCVAVLLWWLLFSRAPWAERLGALGLAAAALAATWALLHESIATGAMGMLFPIFVAPGLGVAFLAWGLASRYLSGTLRRVTMVSGILIAVGAWALVRTGGFTGDLDNDFAFRWSKTPEERLLAQAAGEAMTPAPAAVGAADWPGYLGPERDGVVRGVRIDTDWAQAPPAELWRRPVGPGWSSFAVAGDVFYTQEQRGDDEVVACYRLGTGEPVWLHADAARFWESNGGAGPRGTPTVAGDHVYTLGATGIVNALDARNGAVVWSRDAVADAEVEVPTWGIASSPLVLEDLVVVAASGRLVAYDRATGEPRWLGPARGTSYSSPRLATIDGVEQILQLSVPGLVGVDPADGAVLWEHPWKGYPIVQPALAAGGDILISVTDQSGTRRLAVSRGPGGWTAEERWTSTGLKPYFNHFVAHEGHAYGFDGGILSSIDLDDGTRNWKGGRYGHGQLVLLADQDLLLVLSEKGELALVSATPDRFTELARFPAIESKTWNHPVVTGDTLLVRNGEEMAAFKLARAGG